MRLALALVFAASFAGCGFVISEAAADPAPGVGTCGAGKVCTARRFISTDPSVRVSNGTANYQCNANPGTSSPCVANFSHPLEMGGVKAATPQDDSAAMYIGCMLAADGGSCLDVMNNYGAPGGGAEVSLCRFMYDGELRNWGDLTLNSRQGTDGRVMVRKGPMYLITTGELGAAGPIYVWNKASTDVSEWFSGAGGTSRMKLTAAGTLEQTGDTAVTLQATSITAGSGSVGFDDTNGRWRDGVSSTGWSYRVNVNPDGGAPFGPLHYWTAYNGVTTASTRKLTAITARERTRVMGVSFVPTTVGVGAGTFNIEVRDITGAASLCTSSNISCTSSVGTMSETSCAAIDVAAGNQVAVQIICGGCGTCPLGNATAVMQQL